MKKVFFILIIAIAVIGLLFGVIYFYNRIAEKQRESIRFCQTDTDCQIKTYKNECVGGWSGCFNKNKTPVSNIGVSSAFCDYPPTSCSCVQGKCEARYGLDLQALPTPQPGLTSNARIASFKIDPSCNGLVYTHLGAQKVVSFQINTGFDQSGRPSFRCQSGIRFRTSASGKFIAVESLSGGIDSKMTVFSAPNQQAITLDVYGTSAIFDFIFLSQDYLAVLTGYPSLPDEQYLTIYNIDEIFTSFSNTIDPETNYYIGHLLDKTLDIPTHSLDVASLDSVGGDLRVYGSATPKKQLLAIYSFRQISDFQNRVTGPQAATIVRNQPEVSNYFKRVPNAKIALDHEDAAKNSWVIHVFESLSDHVATFNWYYVNKTTGEITKEFNL